MSDFLVLFKHEFKLQFPFSFKKVKGRKFDVLGSLLSLLISLLIIVVFVFLISSVVENYLAVKINKVEDPIARATELLNVFYAVIILAMGFLGVEKMRKSLTQKKHKELFLRLPVKQQTIFLSKLAVLLLWNYLVAFFLVIPVNFIFFLALDISYLFWLNTALVWLLLPIVPFLISSLLIIPYIKIIDFIKDKYVIIFVLLSVLLISAFLLYSVLLNVVQELLETGLIRFIFNEEFTNTLQSFLLYTYPANSLTNIALGQNMLESILIVLAVSAVAAGVIYYVTKNLYYITLYKNDSRRQNGKKKEKYLQLNPIVSLVKKEFISVFRDSKNVFAYFAIATAMPAMVYCCYTLFESLITNTLGLEVNFSLALLVILIFSVLTNTFCATNITRDGLAALKTKLLPIKAKYLLLAKVLFCSIVSSLAVIVSSIILICATSLGVFDGILCILFGVIFSITQIFVATRLDLNHAKVSLSPVEVESASSKTIAKVVFIGLILALVMGILSMVISIFASVPGNDFVQKLNLKNIYAYVLPAVICLGYFVFGFIYYNRKIENSFANLVM